MLTRNPGNAFITFTLLLICTLPFALNLFGFDFGSLPHPLSTGNLVNSSVPTEGVFYAIEGTFHHALLEWAGVCLAFLTAAISVIHYYIRRDISVAILGLAILSAGTVDSFHALAATRMIHSSIPNTEYILFTWSIARIFHAFVLIAGISVSFWAVKRQQALLHKSSKHNQLTTLAITGVMSVGLAYATLYITAQSVHIPQTIYSNALVTRPLDVMALGMFLLVASLFWTSYRKKPSIVKLAFLLSCIPEVFTQIYMAFGSTSLFDNAFNIAHFMKVLAYSTVFLGIIIQLVISSSKYSSLDTKPNTIKQHSNTFSNDKTVQVGKVKQPLSVLIPTTAFLLAMVVSLTVSVTYYLEDVKRLNQNKLNELTLESQLLESHFQSLLSQSAQDVLFLSNTPPIQTIIESQYSNNADLFDQWSAQLDIIFRELINVKPLYQQLKFIGINSDGKELLSSLKRHFSIYRNPEQHLQHHNNNNDFRETLSLKKGQVFFSAIKLNKHKGKTVLPHQPVIYIQTPVFNHLTGEIFGAISLSLLIDPFFESLIQFESDLILTNANGDYLHHPLLEKRYAFELNNEENLFIDFPVLKQKINTELSEVALSNIENSDGTQYNAYIKQLKTEKYGQSEPLYLLLLSNNKTLEASLSQLKNRSLILAIGLSLVALALAIIASHRITRPLRVLSEAVNEYESTGTIGVLPIEAKDEVGVFSRSFHNMMQRVDAVFNELQEQKFALDQHAIVSITDLKGVISYANNKFCEISGYQIEELIGQNHRIAKSGVHSTQFFTDIFKVIAAGGVWQGEMCNKNKSGDYYWVNSTIVAFKNLEGKPQSYVAIRTDITERKLAEAELVLSKEVAEETLKSKSEFLASMSHEIRTPMNGVLGMLGLLLNTNLNQEQSHRARIAESSAQSLLTIINDILDFSKIEAGKLDLEMLNFNLPKMLGSFSESMAQMAQVKDLELILDTTRLLESDIIGDPGRIRQILTNLVSNAIKFTENGEVIIRANLHEYNEKHWMLEFQIRDTGIGIPTKKQAKLFDAFSQVDASTTREFGGTGLGLSIVKQLCRLMQGDVTLKSEEGKGSTFFCNMIVEKTDQVSISMPRVDISNLNILIVDDNDTNLDVLHSQLLTWGSSVTEAKSGEQALSICAERAACTHLPFFDLAIIDMQMPKMDGAELGKTLAMQPDYQSMKLVMMTSMNFQGDAKKLAQLGFSAYFPKPATTSDLFDSINVLAEGGEALEHADPLVTKHSLKSLNKNSPGQEVENKRQLWPEKTRVLLVEDNQINQLVATTILKENGLHADVAGNGIEALSSLTSAPLDAPFSVVLMDCQMPEMDGYECSQSIRAGKAGERNNEIPIIAMTANAMQGDKDKCLAAGMSDYLSKPINTIALLDKLQKWLKLPIKEEIQEQVQKQTAQLPAEQIENDVNKIWDEAEVLERIGGKADFLIVLINNFLQDRYTKSEEIKQAFKEDNFRYIRELAHSVKGVAGQLAGKKMMSVSAKLEEAAKTKNRAKTEALIPEFEHALKELSTVFDEHVEKHSVQTDQNKNEEIIPIVELTNKLSSLKKMLHNSDYIDPDDLLFLSHGHQDAHAVSLLKKFKQQIIQFDNAAALTTLTEITNHINIDIEQVE